MAKVKIENWSMIGKGPLIPVLYLVGDIYGHPRFDDGKNVITSRVVRLNLLGREAETLSGNLYILGVPDAKWVEWMYKEGYTDTLGKLFPN